MKVCDYCENLHNGRGRYCCKRCRERAMYNREVRESNLEARKVRYKPRKKSDVPDGIKSAYEYWSV